MLSIDTTMSMYHAAQMLNAAQDGGGGGGAMRITHIITVM